MVGALFDTNILIDHLHAVPEARAELGRFEDRAISIITWMEVLAGAGAKQEEATRQFLRGFRVLGVDEGIAERAVQLRRRHRVKLADAIIWSTAQTTKRLLVTRVKGLEAGDPGIRQPYK